MGLDRDDLSDHTLTMALSDYDHLSFGPDGKPSQGQFITPDGFIFRLYKTWVYIGHDKLWQNGVSCFTRPTLMQLNTGALSLGANSILMVPSKTLTRGHLVFIRSCTYEKGESKTAFFAGIVCSGYDGNRVMRNICKALRVNPGEWEMDCTTYGDNDERYHTISNPKTKRTKNLHYRKGDRLFESRYVGVTKRGVAELLAFLAREIGDYDTDASKWLVKVRRTKAVRFNQGDVYFARHLKTATPATRPSKAAKPVATQLIGA